MRISTTAMAIIETAPRRWVSVTGGATTPGGAGGGGRRGRGQAQPGILPVELGASGLQIGAPPPFGAAGSTRRFRGQRGRRGIALEGRGRLRLPARRRGRDNDSRGWLGRRG